MRFASWPSALAAALFVLPGCYESFSSGDPIRRDGGPVIVLPDGGPARDAGVRRDSGVRDAGPRVDGGVCVNGERVPEYEGPACSRETLECLQACRDRMDPPECDQDCYAFDPDCVTCLNHRLIVCFNERRCQDVWDRFACCTERECPGLSSVDRIECAGTGLCLEEIQAYSECAGDISLCEDEYARCFE